MSERAKNFFTDQHQISSDEELYDKAKINYKSIYRIDLAKIVQAVVDFAELLSGITLYKYERNFAERVTWSLLLSDGETIVAEFARQTGKSQTLASLLPSVTLLLPLISEYIFKSEKGELFKKNKNLQVFKKFLRGFWCGVYGPDYDRASIIGNKINSTLVSKEARIILSSEGFDMKFPEKLSNYIGRLPRNSFIKVKSANRRVSVEGETFHLVVIDETQEVSDYVLKKSISPFTASTLGTTVFIGSAYPKRVYFYDIGRMQHEKDLEENHPVKYQNYFRTDYKEAQLYNDNYRIYIEKEKFKLGETSDEFRMSYELFWPVEKGMFITEDFLITRLGEHYGVSNYDMNNDHVIGIDLGKVNDSTVITIVEVDWENPILVDANSGIIRYKKKVKNWFEIQGDDYDAQFYMICNFIDHYLWHRLIVDATGVGAPMFDRLYNKYDGKKGKSVKPFVYNKASKSEAFSLLYTELLAERWVFPISESVRKLKKFQNFVNQMVNLSKTIENGYLVVKSTSETLHDDYCDSLVLANYAVESEFTEQEVEEKIENIYRNSRFGRGLFKNSIVENNFWG